jgi:hypothetical protein
MLISLNALVMLGYQELNSFYYTDAVHITRIVQKIIWILILWVIFKKSINEA